MPTGIVQRWLYYIAFNFATIVHLENLSFRKRFISWKDDPLGKTLGQMVGASRSGKQNIVEGSERAKTSAETEIKLTDVAKASLAELLGEISNWRRTSASVLTHLLSDDDTEEPGHRSR